MLNKSKRIFALLLAAIMVFSLVGCNKKVEEESSGGVEYIIQEEIEYVTEDGDAATGDNDTDDGNKPSGDGTQQSSKPTGNSSSGGKDTQKPSNYINNKVDPSKYKGKTIQLALTVDPDTDEGGPVIDAFEKKYGIKVKFVKIDSKNYANELNGLIAADEAPDVAISNGDFPVSISYLQSLDAAKLDYDEDIWNQKTFEISTFAGSPYLCDTINNIWAEVDLVAYSKKLLKRAGVKTPEQYDKEGNWTWDTYFDICRAVKNLGPNMYGGGFQSRENAIHAMGGGFIVHKDGKFASGINERTQAAMVKYTEAWKEEIIEWKSSDGIINGTVGISTLHSYALKKTGFFNSSTGYDAAGDLGFYYLPRWDKNSDYGNTGMVRGYGIIKRAKEPVAAGIFLREYLDVANYDIDNAFISEDAKNFFFEITSVDYNSWNPYFLYFGDQDAIAGFGGDNVYNSAMSGDPAQVGSVMGALKGKMEKAASNFNDYTKKNAGAR